MEISAQLVKTLRERTGTGMMECKKALAEVGGDLDKAIDYLRKKGLHAASSKAARIAADGTIVSLVSADGKVGGLLEINCETDFVAKNEDFLAFSNQLISLIIEKGYDAVDKLLAAKMKDGESVSEKLNYLVAKVGEKISLRRFIKATAGKDESLGSYIHLGSKIGVLVKLGGQNVEAALVKDLAMHIAASQPQYIDRSDIPRSVIESEKEIYRQQMKDTAKPANIIEKIIDGKISKFVSEICLNDQIYIKDPTGKKKVSQVLQEIDSSIKILSYYRYQVGEGIEKKSNDFAQEVSRMVK